MILSEKALFWRSGTRSRVFVRQNGLCACCGWAGALVAQENKFEFNHISPVNLGGFRSRAKSSSALQTIP